MSKEIVDAYRVYLKGSSKNKFSVVSAMGKRPKIDVDLGMLHVIGYWEGEENPTIREIWIPYSEIRHVESLICRRD